MDVIIRAAAPEDAPAVNQILTETWKAAYVGIVPQEYLDSLDAGRKNRIQDDLYAAKQKMLLLFEDGVPAGAVGYGKSREESRADWGEIQCLYVRPGFWRRGYGGKLLRAALGDLEGEGFRKFYLWVMAESRNAREFYRAMSFAPTKDANSYEIAGERIEDVRYIRRLDRSKGPFSFTAIFYPAGRELHIGWLVIPSPVSPAFLRSSARISRISVKG